MSPKQHSPDCLAAPDSVHNTHIQQVAWQTMLILHHDFRTTVDILISMTNLKLGDQYRLNYSSNMHAVKENY